MMGLFVQEKKNVIAVIGISQIKNLIDCSIIHSDRANLIVK
jgi:hypothetical protein